MLAFQVAVGATKVDIKRAVEQLLNTKVPKFGPRSCTARRNGKAVSSAHRPDWKKAYVRLRPGAPVPEFLEGA